MFFVERAHDLEHKSDIKTLSLLLLSGAAMILFFTSTDGSKDTPSKQKSFYAALIWFSK
jgi:predicted membrane protein